MSRRQIAVVGSGVAGLTAAYILQRTADVTLYEADSRLGGHAHTHDLLDRTGRSVQVDTGSIGRPERCWRCPPPMARKPRRWTSSWPGATSPSISAGTSSPR